MNKNAKRRIVVLGGGSGGLELVAELCGRTEYDIVLVDQVSTHLWKPRLHEFAAGTVNSTLTEISFYMLASMRGFHFEQGRVEGVDPGRKVVRLGAMHTDEGHLITAAREISYDFCVVALGGVTPDFGTTGVAECAIRLDKKSDADEFRDLFIATMIHARESRDTAHIVIVGSGATGTELAAHLRLAERAFFESSDGLLGITILEAAPEIMPGADKRLRDGVLQRLAALKVDVHVSAKIEEVTDTEVKSADGNSWSADLVVWAAGLVGHPCLKKLADFDMDSKGRIVVDEHLRSTIDDSIYVLGDAASLKPDGSDHPLPPTAQCASQQAAYLAKAFPVVIDGGQPEPFKFTDKGRLISLGRAGSLGKIDFMRRNDFMVHGQFAAAAYRGLQRQHQWSVLGPVRGSVAILADMISPTKGPAMKLHG